MSIFAFMVDRIERGNEGERGDDMQQCFLMTRLSTLIFKNLVMCHLLNDQ